MKKIYGHITEKGYAYMEKVKPGTLLRVEWIEDPDVNAEWGLHIIDFEDYNEENNVVMLIKWMPEIRNITDVITFKCLWQDKLYFSSTKAIIELIHHETL
jgi:hypothetical protein